MNSVLQRPVATLRKVNNLASTRTCRLPPLRVLADPPAQQDSAEGSVPWFKKNAHLWVEIKNKEELTDIIRAYPNKLAVVEFYAGWCGSCRTAYPNMCRIAGDAKLQETLIFAKANIEEETVRDLVKENSITGIPYVGVFDANAELVIGFSASFKKMDRVKAGIALIAEHPQSRFAADANGFLQVVESCRLPATAAN